MICIIICILIINYMLSINGYSISKTSLDAKQIEKIKKELTMKPQVNFDMGIKNNEPDPIFEL